jgi:dihydroxyacetone kinase-like protein
MGDTIDLKAFLQRAADIMKSHREELCAIDAKIGDGDIGLTMSKGFVAAAKAAASPDHAPSNVLKTTAMTLMSTVPSTMGTLLAGGFLAAAKATIGIESVDAAALAKTLRALADAIAARGKSARGDKTILDALYPALDVLDAAAPDEPLPAVLDRMAAAARDGAEATRSMQAKHGRAARYLEKSVGHIDAGATVGAYLIQALRMDC